MTQDSSIWQVNSHAASVRTSLNTNSVPLKWAHDSRTGEPRYIHDAEVIDGNARCKCPACDLSLTPVLAGQPLSKKPTAHFRHPKGGLKDDCTLIAARLAAIRHLQERGFIDLPRRRMSANATGFSGEGYGGWAEAPEQRISISGAVFHDYATALLTLDDGRELLVDLTGHRDAGSDGHGRAIVTLSLSDLSIAMMSPEEIRARLRLLPDIRWCAHWNDQALQTTAVAHARQAAQDAMDAWGDADEELFRRDLPSNVDPSMTQKWRRETLLHSEVKSILGKTSQIATPGLEVEVLRSTADEFSDVWEDCTLRILWMSASQTLSLATSQLEQRQGRIVPDVICTLSAPQSYIYGGTEIYLDGDFQELIEDTYSSYRWPQTLLIEITVTHGIDQVKLRRIQELDLPTLEIDISSLGGQVTREGLRNLIVNETIGKRWVHHPIWRFRRRVINSELSEHPAVLHFQERLTELRRPRFLAATASEWATIYLAAAKEFYETNTHIEKARRAHKGDKPKPVLLDKDSMPWKQLMEASEALAMHGYPGGTDSEMVGVAGIIPRLLSIKHNRGIGYAFNTGYQVLNAIMQCGTDDQQWHTLYPIAVKAYELEAKFTKEQKQRYANWRQGIIDKVNASDKTHLRPALYDAVLGVLFPPMAPRLANGYGLSK